mgnify:CR=1 FL=1
MMMADCAETCGVCTTSCMDHDEGCKGWAYAGKCSDDASRDASIDFARVSIGVGCDPIAVSAARAAALAPTPIRRRRA